jgi:hypothetical protein
MKLFRIVAVSAMGALSMGCGGAPIVGTTSVKTPTSEIVRAHRAILVRAEPAKPDWQAEGAELTKKLTSALEGLRLFTAVIDGSAQSSDGHPDVELVISITDVMRVTASERDKLGESAGQAKLSVSVALRDKADNSDAGAAAFEAKGYVGPLGGTTEDAENEVVRRIARYVSGVPTAD